MGVMRFEVHPASLLDEWPELHRAYISGFDGRVFPTRIEVEGNVIACRRQAGDSGKLHIAWPVEGFGRPVVTTSCLREQDEAYNLTVELARGKICQVRNQLATWEGVGMKIPDEFFPIHKESHKLFAQAVCLQGDAAKSSELASQAIVKSCKAAELLVDAYIEQRLAVRRHRSQQLPASLGCNLGNTVPGNEWPSQICTKFTAASIPVSWKHVEPAEGEYFWELYDEQVDWCTENKMLMRGGPLLDMSPGGLPAWLSQWEHDFFNLQSFLCDYVETAISRYLGKIRTWEISSRVNTGGALQLNEENRLTLVARTLEVARQVDEEAKLLIRVDQPWGEYQARGQHRLSPAQFIDALLRCGVGLSGVNLEVAVGYSSRGSASRDVLDFSRMIDQWSTLEIPLHVTLIAPSATTADEHADADVQVDPAGWKSAWSQQMQAEWLDAHLPLLMAKQSVVGIFWGNLSDAGPHEYPNSGLISADGTPKQTLAQFADTRAQHWS
ncbi:MAG: glycoside hydrolase [Planctomycetaceae bacterium]|nr:glycoside hydrolase [Planctomycetaceae bacterium]